MQIPSNYLEINRNSWNQRTQHHIGSSFYDVPSFMAGKSPLNSIELDLLADVKGKKILHLQCHFGLDSLALARMGAEVTGVDFSEESIKHAKRIAAEADLNARFICCDVFELPARLSEEFDIVFSSYGVIGWHPDLKPWAELIDKYLRPGGKLVFAEFHPFIWAFDNDFQKITYSYFNKESIIETETGSYASEKDAFVQDNITWNHSLSEVLNNLIANNLQLVEFHEYDYSPYNCFNNTVEIAENRWQIKGMEGKIPMVYALTAIKKNI